MANTSIQADTIIEGPFWPEPVRVLRMREHGSTVQIEAVGVVDSRFYDQTECLPDGDDDRRIILGLLGSSVMAMAAPACGPAQPSGAPAGAPLPGFEPEATS